MNQEKARETGDEAERETARQLNSERKRLVIDRARAMENQNERDRDREGESRQGKREEREKKR